MDRYLKLAGQGADIFSYWIITCVYSLRLCPCTLNLSVGTCVVMCHLWLCFCVRERERVFPVHCRCRDESNRIWNMEQQEEQLQGIYRLGKATQCISKVLTFRTEMRKGWTVTVQDSCPTNFDLHQGTKKLTISALFISVYPRKQLWKVLRVIQSKPSGVGLWNLSWSTSQGLFLAEIQVLSEVEDPSI